MRAIKTSMWGAAAGAAFGLAAYWYAHQIERVRVSLDQITLEVDKPGLPPGGLTILHLSDFHFRARDPVQEARLERLAALLAPQRYDILAFTGDLIHNEAGLPRALAFLRELHPTLGAFSVPGNRDYWESGFKAILGTPEERAGLTWEGRLRLASRRASRVLRRFADNEGTGLHLHKNDVRTMHRALEAQGIQPLINRSTNVRGLNYDLWFAGVDDLTQGEPDIAAALAGVPTSAPLVLLAHNPDVWLDGSSDAAMAARSVARRADLVLSGHTHGGQLNLPVIGAWYRQGAHVDRHKAAGWFVDGSSHMFVSRGLGESFPFRVRTPPQAALIRLMPGQKKSKPVG